MAAGIITSVPSVLADTQVFQYVGPSGEVILTDSPVNRTNRSIGSAGHDHRSISDGDLEEAVGRAARQHRIQPALLLAVIKAESSFNPIVVSKVGAVGLMQLIPETAIRHGVQNLYDTEENVTGGARHLRYLLDRFHGNLRLAIAAYNAGERTVDRYGKIPPYKETRLYVQKVMTYYREYKKGGWVVPVTNVGLSGQVPRTF
jgi:soluble lytic murein transglycosylase